MGLKKRSKVSAEFSMSSLTDIIFLLLIFFMLTANFVKIDNLELPKSDSVTVAPTSIAVSLAKNGDMKLNGELISMRKLTSAVRRELAEQEDRQNATITIVAEVGVPFKRVTEIMNVAKQLRMKAILATSPKG
ncbi:MAG: biopolymer transport protein ExbD [Polaribacter sp.]|jgi:biopolymer transport protein ExbD